jgi:RsiW-degrading membrane proteinase PrsW (M82 family)
VAVTTVLPVIGFIFLAELASRTKGNEHDNLVTCIFWGMLVTLALALIQTLWMIIRRDKEPLWILVSAAMIQGLMLMSTAQSLAKIASR